MDCILESCLPQGFVKVFQVRFAFTHTLRVFVGRHAIDREHDALSRVHIHILSFGEDVGSRFVAAVEPLSLDGALLRQRADAAVGLSELFEQVAARRQAVICRCFDGGERLTE